jgi:anti-anti-sigma factor
VALAEGKLRFPAWVWFGSVAAVDIRLRKVRSATVLDLYGALIIGDPERDLRDHVNKAIAAGARHIAVNLTAVPYIDSSGMAAMIGILKSVRQAGGKCQFYGANKNVRQLCTMIPFLTLSEDEESALGSEGSSDDPTQHYIFAHRILPQIVHADPKKAQEILSGPAGADFLASLWRRVGESIPVAAHTPPNGLTLMTRTEADGTVIVVVTMPRPTRLAEAWFVAIVFTPGPRKLLFFQGPPMIRYFTLELGSNLSNNTPRTVLCGWSKEGNHFNVGDGPPPEVEAFLARILAIE